MGDKIKNLINKFLVEYEKQDNIKSSWRTPIVKFLSVEDEGLLKLKEIISPTHASPKDFLEDAKTIISYFIPFSKEIVESNKGERESSREWAIAYVETNELIKQLNIYINNELSKLGYNSTIIPATHNFDEKKLISDWSHRHIAYLAGLGSFGLNNMLITEKGCCGRVGSIITNLKISSDKQVLKERCLYKVKGICKACVDKCVNDALKIDGFDRHKCYEMCLINAESHKEYGLTDVCGKCLVGLPCSISSPVK